MTNSFGARSTLNVGGTDYEIYKLDAVTEGHVGRLPYSLKILLENLLRFEDGRDVTRDDILALANWNPKATPDTEISFTPSRVILQDFTGVPAVVDLAAMRDAVVKLGGSAEKEGQRPNQKRPEISQDTDSHKDYRGKKLGFDTGFIYQSHNPFTIRTHLSQRKIS